MTFHKLGEGRESKGQGCMVKVPRDEEEGLGVLSLKQQSGEALWLQQHQLREGCKQLS